MIKLGRLFTFPEWQAAQEEALAKGWYWGDKRMFPPGTGWFTPWVYDPTGERERNGDHVYIKSSERGRTDYLSEHYWRDWADKRPPICIMGPGGEQWEIDRKSSNGSGWVVTGEWPDITCTPSIVLSGYHGYLTNGEFTSDVENRPDNLYVQLGS